MATLIRVKHNRTGKESTFTPEQWDKIKADPNWFGVYSIVKVPEAPPEAKAAKERAAEVKAEMQSPGVDSKTTPTEKK